jgi:hypothetical protein
MCIAVAELVPYAQILGALIALIGGAIAVQTLRLNARTNKSKFIIDLTESIIKDKDIADFWYRLNYDDKWVFDLQRFRHSPEERCLDTLLYRCSVIGQLLRMKSLKCDDIANVFFRIQQIFKNSQVRRYFEFLMLDLYRDARQTDPHWPDAIYLYEELLKLNERSNNEDARRQLKNWCEFVTELKQIPYDSKLRETVASRIKYDRPIP